MFSENLKFPLMIKWNNEVSKQKCNTKIMKYINKNKKIYHEMNVQFRFLIFQYYKKHLWLIVSWIIFHFSWQLHGFLSYDVYFFRSVAKQNKYEISQITMTEKVIDQENIWKLCRKTLLFQEREFLENLENVTFEKYKIIVSFI